MSRSERRLTRWLNGTVDVSISVLLAALVVVVALARGDWRPAALDLLACLCAALTVRLPRSAGSGLGIILGILLLLPPGWGSLAEYATLIPILGTGIRGQRAQRLWMTAIYGALLAALTLHLSQGRGLWVFGLMVWAALISVLWGIGNLFTAYRTASERSHAAELQQQRLMVARDLHDSVSRELAKASLQAQAARQGHPSTELDAVVNNIHQASTQLRWMLSLLRDDPSGHMGQIERSPVDALRAGTEALQAKGFTVSTNVDGDLDDLPAAIRPIVRAVIGEACTNIERHADPDHPRRVVISVDDNAFDAVFMNEVRLREDARTSLGMGLTGLAERLALVGGELAVEQRGSQWLSRVIIPF